MPQEPTYLDPKNDFAFKKIFGSEQNKDILITFLNDVLNHDHVGQIVEVTFLPTVKNPEIAAQKESLFDVLCRDQNGVQYIVEVQIARTDNFLKRAEYYASKAYSRQLEQGQDYSELKEVIFLAITDFVLFPKKNPGAVKTDHFILDKNTHEHDLKGFSFTFIELPKFKKKLHELENDTERWYFYLKHAPETVKAEYEELIKQTPILERAYDVLLRYNWNEAELNTYEGVLKNVRDAASKINYAHNEGIKQGRKAGIKEGIQKGREEGKKLGLQKGRLEGREEGEKLGLQKGRLEGRKEGKKEGEKLGLQKGAEKIAQQMFADGASTEKIQKWTGLSVAQIETLKGT